MHRLTRTKLTLVTLLATVVSVAGLSVHKAQAAMIQDCSANSVISCGAASPADLIAKIKANATGDLPAIYGAYGLTPENYDAFAKDAKVGTAKMNGDLVVDGQVVSRNDWSLGRQAKSYSQPMNVGGITLHKSASTDVLRQDLPTFVWFDENGKPKLAVISACGNPLGGTGVKPSYKCDQLKYQPVKDEANTYQFMAVAPVSDNAVISRVVYNFGDGTPEETRSKPDEVVTHTFAKDGTFNAKVTVYVKLPGGKEVSVSGTGCAKKITIKAPEKAAWQCTNLKATPKTNTDNDDSYTLRASATMSKARLVSGDFDFGDGESQNNVEAASTSSNNISVDHTYSGPGDYTAKATLKFEAEAGAQADGDSTTATCEASFTIKQPETPATPPSTPEKPAQELPNTGVAGAAGVFTGVSTLGTLGYRWRAHRRLSKVDSLVDKLQR